MSEFDFAIDFVKRVEAAQQHGRSTVSLRIELANKLKAVAEQAAESSLSALRERLAAAEAERDAMKKWPSVKRCSKCGRLTTDTPKQKYCGDGSDKDNSHRWVPIEQQPAAAAKGGA